MMEPPSKKVKYDQTWKAEYSKTFKDVFKSDKGAAMAFCEMCKSHFSIKSGGAYDIKRHMTSQKHVAAQRAAGGGGMASMMSSFVKKEDHSVINAEVVFTKFLMEKNLPLAIADDAGDLFRKMFPKSEEAKQYKCARTKTTAIVHVLAENQKSKTLDNVRQSGVFSLSTDGGNDTKQKLFPVIVRYADMSEEKIVTEILSVDTLSSTTATGKDIFSHVKDVVDKSGLDLIKCISFSVDNAAVMVGEKSGVAAHLHAVNENINIIGCPCHRLNLAALKAANSLSIKLDQFLIDIYFFLDKSSKRVARLRELQEILGCESHEILKHVNTRWLSLGPCLSRLLEQWEPLSALFLELSEDSSSNSTQSKAKSVLTKLMSDEVKAYALFLVNVIPLFENANALLQSDVPLVHKVRGIMMSVIKELCTRFLKPQAIKDTDLLRIDASKKSNLLPNSEIDVGYKCRKLVEKDLDVEQQDKFYKSVVSYFKSGVEYLQKKCNLNDKAIVHACVADPNNQMCSSVVDLNFFVERFPSLLPADVDIEESMEKLVREFRCWQTDDCSMEGSENAADYWFRMAKVESQCGGRKYAVLSKVMLGILAMFHSNAACERLFSLVRRNRTDFRHSMSNKLVESLSVCKSAKSSFRDTIPKDVLVKAKSATAAALAKQ